MNIAVMSPHTQKSGNTVVASLIAYELSGRNRKVCLTHTKNKSYSLYSYFHLNEVQDRTCNPMQILNLIREGGIRKNDISDYCKGITDNLEIFSLNSEQLSEDRQNDVMSFVCANFPHDYVIFDFDDNDLGSEINRNIMRSCDCVVYVLTQSITELKEFSEKRSHYLYWSKNIPSIVVVNRYCDIVGDIKQVAAQIGIRNPRKWFRLTYNPWVPYCTNNGKMKYLYEHLQKRDYHVVDVDSDIKTLVNGILSLKHSQQLSRYGNSSAY